MKTLYDRITESVLSSNYGDDFDTNLLDSYLEKLGEYSKNRTKYSKKEYDKFWDDFKNICRIAADKFTGGNDETFIRFKEEGTLSGQESLGTFKKVIEISRTWSRAIEMAWSDNTGMILCREGRYVGKPKPSEARRWTCLTLSHELYDKIWDAMFK